MADIQYREKVKFDFENFWQRYLPSLIFVLLVLIALVSFLRPATDPDLGWHIRYGEIVYLENRFIRYDEFSHTMAGYTFSPYFLSEVIFYLLFRFGGLLALSVLSSLLATVPFLLVAKFTVKKTPILAVAILIFAAIFVAMPFAGVRIQLISWLFFAIFYLVFIGKYYLNLKVMFLLPLAIALWANLHFGFLIGIALFGLFFLVESFKFVILKFYPNILWLKKDVLTQKELVLTAFGLCATILASFITPYGLGAYKSALGFATSSINLSNIAEWLPLSVKTDFGFAFTIYIFFLLWLVVGKIKALSSFELVTFLGLVLAAFTSVRHLPFALLVSGSILLKVWPKFKINRTFLPALRFYGVGVLILIFAVIGYSQVKEAAVLAFNFEKLSQKAGYPYAAVNYLVKNPIAGKMLNEYNWGGYLVWQLPDKKTFIDGRMPGWKQNERDILADYLAIWKVTPQTDELLSKYQVNFAILALDSPITTYLQKSGWQIVFSDDKSTILRLN